MRNPSGQQRRAVLANPPAQEGRRLPGRRLALLRALPVIAAAALLMAPLAIVGGFPETHEVFRYPALLTHFSDAWSAGVLYPRWLPHLAGGYGYPTFVFYQPLFFFVSAAVERIAGLAPPRAVWLACFLLAVLGTTGMYRLSRLFADVRVSLFVAALYALTPYQYVDLYVRGDFSEFASIQIVPWILFCAVVLWRRSSNGLRLMGPAAGLAGSLALVVVAHPLTALAAWGVAAAILLALLPAVPRGRRVRYALVGAGAFLLAAIVSSVYWYPVAQLHGAVGADAAFEGYFSTARHVVHLVQLFRREFGFGDSRPDTASDGMSFQLGMPHFLLATLGAWFGRRQRVLAACYAAYLALVLLMLPPCAPIWNHVPVMRFFQFPWRLLAVIASLQAVCAVGWTYVSFRDTRNWHFRSVLLATLVLATGIWHCNLFFVQPGVDFRTAEKTTADLFFYRTRSWQTYAAVEEFLPRTAKPIQTFRRDRDLLEVDQGLALPMDHHSPYHLRFKVRSAAPTRAIIHQYYFPGWRVLVGGKAVPRELIEHSLTEDGRMTLALPACPEGLEVEAWYDGPPGGRMRCAMALAAVAVFTWVMVRQDRRLECGSRLAAGVSVGHNRQWPPIPDSRPRGGGQS
ncbi:MAG: hypothetical protein HUU20_26120 [Pirellulales bacterium]|nr:hypothetical protein [Pirellulales bacterium]